jgi:hypothetical protein
VYDVTTSVVTVTMGEEVAELTALEEEVVELEVEGFLSRVSTSPTLPSAPSMKENVTAVELITWSLLKP